MVRIEKWFIYFCVGNRVSGMTGTQHKKGEIICILKRI
mgnify:FL=1